MDSVKRESIKDKPKRKCKPKKEKIETDVSIDANQDKPKSKKARKSKIDKTMKDGKCILGIEVIDKKGEKRCELPSISNSPEVIFSKVHSKYCQYDIQKVAT